jgi:hypothetical protein
MFLQTKIITTKFTRKSRLGVEHTYGKNKTIAIFECDNCKSQFERDLGKVDHRRLSNHVTHVCSNCNQKQFAQRKGVEQRRFWNLPVDSDINISNI